MAATKKLEVTAIVDRLGKVKAQIATLKEEEDGYKAALIEAQVEEVDGTQYRATVSYSFRTVVDYKTILAEVESMLTPAQQKKLTKLLEGNTKQSESTTVRVVSR